MSESRGVMPWVIHVLRINIRRQHDFPPRRVMDFFFVGKLKAKICHGTVTQKDPQQYRQSPTTSCTLTSPSAPGDTRSSSKDSAYARAAAQLSIVAHLLRQAA